MKLSALSVAVSVALIAAIGTLFHDPAVTLAAVPLGEPAGLSALAVIGSAGGLGSRAIIGKFYERIGAALSASWIPQIAMPITSDQEIETYKWLGQVPTMREWIGGRQAKGLRENGLSITNKTWEGTLRVSLDEIRRDKTGQVNIRINEQADRAVTHEQSLLSTLILNGATSVCYDGQYFFDTDHTEGDNTTSQSNSITFDLSDEVGSGSGTAANPTPITMQRAIMKAVATMLGFKDDQNEPFNELAKDFLVMVPPSLMAPTLSALSLPTLDAGASNIIVASKDFKIQPAVNTRLSSWTDKFAVFRTDGAAKPLITQEEEALSVSAVAEGSEHEFKNNEHLYGVKRIGNVGYGLWQQACLVTMQA